MLLEIRLTPGEVNRAFDTPHNPFGPVLSLKEAALLAKIAPSTLKRLVSEGQFAQSVKRGKPLAFLARQVHRGVDEVRLHDRH